MEVVFALLPIAVVGVVLIVVGRLRSRSGSLSRVSVEDGQVVVEIDAPVWLAFRRRLSAPLSDVTGARVVEPGTRAGLWVRTWGASVPGLYLGWYWRPGGLVYVIRRPSRPSVEIDVLDGRTRQWLVETPDPEDVVAKIGGSKAT